MRAVAKWIPGVSPAGRTGILPGGTSARILDGPDRFARQSGLTLDGRRGSLTPRCCLITLSTLLLSNLWAEPLPENPKSPQPFSIRWTADQSETNRISVEVAGLSASALQHLRHANWKPAQWQRLLSVYVQQGDLLDEIGVPPMLGAYQVERILLRFQPKFPLDPGVKYRAVFHPDQLPGERALESRYVSAAFQVPSRGSDPTTVVSQVYPSAELLPENLLKFYLHFSAPMSRGHIYGHIHLRNQTGQEIELPFLEIDEELWDPTMTRLTLFLDPGRIKHGVRPLEEVGPALEAGQRYTLVIDRAWKDGSGKPLKETFQKTFKVGPPDRDPPDPTQWLPLEPSVPLEPSTRTEALEPSVA